MLLCFVFRPERLASGRLRVLSLKSSEYTALHRIRIMRKAKIYRYCLPMDSGVILRDNKLTERKGYILELTDGDKVGRGEVAPLVGFS